MRLFRIAGLLCTLALIGLVQLEPARAQEPSAAATALGKEILELKGGLGIFDGVISGVVEHHRRVLLQTDPNLDKDLGVMDATALSLCRDNDVRMRVFGMGEPGNVTRALVGENIGTLVTTD